MDEPTTSEVLRRLEDVQQWVEKIDGKVDKHGECLARMDERLKHTETATRAAAGKWGAGAGGFVGGLIAVLAQVFGIEK